MRPTLWGVVLLLGACSASIQAAIVEVLVKKSLNALKEQGIKCLVIAGGVGANATLRQQLGQACERRGIRLHYPELRLCTDNGAMIALAAALRWQAGVLQFQSDYAIDVKPRWDLQAYAQEAGQTVGMTNFSLI